MIILFKNNQLYHLSSYRLELELGIKKQQSKDSPGISSEYSSFNANVIAYPSPPQQQQQQQMMYRQQPTVLQVFDSYDTFHYY